uniref:serine palmitoyltransferase 1-like n=1 Tax=Styela clava TaxID=7725 RepID=UPI00193A0F4E|nr:serine palmitoyltransferase 1-like [Styela clava]
MSTSTTTSADGSEWMWVDLMNALYQAPLYHLSIEALLVLWIVRLMFFKSYKIEEKVPLTEKEKQELIDQWQPEPLVPKLTDPLKPYKVVTGQPGKRITVNSYDCLNLASMNFLGFLGNKRIEEKSTNAIKKYGVGSCGPRGFYGTVDVHLDLENRLAKYIGAEEAIIYAYGFATIASAIPAYSKRGDIIYADECVCFAIQKGNQASRSKIVYFKHNDMEDLEAKLKEQELKDKKEPKRASVTRKFIVVEGIYANTGNICPLPKLIELKYRYKVRLFIEETFSFGVLGEHGRGVTEHFNIPIEKVDLVAGSLEYSLASIGGFCAGRTYVIDHQRLSGQGYVFSASLPPLLSCAAIEALDIMEEDTSRFSILRKNGSFMQQMLSNIPSLEVVGNPESPVFHLHCKLFKDRKREEKYMESLVDMCMKEGVALTLAARLEQEELLQDQSPSIRVCVSSEMSEDELRQAANIIEKAAAKLENDR